MVSESSSPPPAPTPSSTPPPSPRRLRAVVVAGNVGSVIEYFDFTIYAFQAVTLAAVFFPSENPTAALLSTLAVFAASFLMRPIGGLVLGHIGDRFGRKLALTVAVVGMGLATLAIGLTPSYATIGILAPVLLALFRCIQALAAGGELGGAGAYVAETSPMAERGFLTSFTQLGAIAGTALGSLTVTVLALTLTPAQLHDFGWRIPFILSVVLTVAAFLFRRRIEESPDFVRLENRSEVSRLPIVTLLTRHPLAVVRVATINLVSFAAYYLVFTFMTTYFGLTGTLDPVAAGWAVFATLVLAGACIPFWGRVSDRVGRKPVMIGVCIAFIVLTYPMFLLIGSGPVGAVIGIIVLGQFQGAYTGVIAAAYSEMFPATVRASGFSLGFNIAAIIAGGSAPLVAAWLLDATGNDQSPALFVMAAAVVSLLFLLPVKETAGKPLPLD
jgi:MFS transporter, MHS family, proline/betaine transporter